MRFATLLHENTVKMENKVGGDAKGRVLVACVKRTEPDEYRNN